MAQPQTFEQLFIWQEARRLTHCVYHLTAAKSWQFDRALRDQVRRAAVSIMANIAEGFERDSQRELARFLSIAKASAGELRSHLYAAEDLGYVKTEAARAMRRRASQLTRQIHAMRQAATRCRQETIRADQEGPASG
jgi:four helix bundle protein